MEDQNMAIYIILCIFFLALGIFMPFKDKYAGPCDFGIDDVLRLICIGLAFIFFKAIQSNM